MAQDQTITILILEGVLYILLSTFILSRSSFKEKIAQAVIIYCIASSLWQFSEVFRQLGTLNILTGVPDVFIQMPFYGLFLLTLLLFYLSQTFLRLPPISWKWWALGVVWLTVLITVDSGLWSIPNIVWSGNGSTIHRINITSALILFGWMILVINIIFSIVNAYRGTKQPLYKNRLNYWRFALGMIITGDILTFIGFGVVFSGNLRLLGTLIGVYTVLKHHLPDVRLAARRAISYTLITILTSVIYTGSFVIIQYLFQSVPGFSPSLFTGAVVALILSVLFQPLLGVVRGVVNQLVFGKKYDINLTLREYGASISNILDLERLATVATGLINEALEIKQGSLFIVQYNQNQNAKSSIYLDSIHGMGANSLPSGRLTNDSFIVEYLNHNRHPIMQYDIDLQPDFEELSETERAWFSSLGMDIYIPIYAKDIWIGLLALGPKISGDRYFAEDLQLLTTLANQTAVALENARLVEDLKKVNLDLKKIYSALEQANQQLQELDKLKSSFIGVITHELRTPYANILFSLEIIERHGPKILTRRTTRPNSAIR